MKKIIMVCMAACMACAAFAQQEIPAEFPKAAIAGKSSGNITVEEVLAAGALTATNPELRIVAFAFTFKIGETMNSLVSDSDKITDAMRNSVASIRKGDRLYVEKIQAQLPDGNVISLQPLPFTVTE